MILERTREAPSALAVDDGVRTRTRAELVERSWRVAHWLRGACGVGPGEHVALLMENRAEVVELLLGSVLAGVWLTPINWHWTRDEVAYVVADSGARVLLAGPQHEAMARDVSAVDSGGALAVCVAGEMLERELADASAAPWSLDGPAGGPMIYTSGTTGRPKGVKRARPPSLEAALGQMGAIGRQLGLDGSGPHLVTGPMYHAAPLMFAIYDLANGALLLSLPRWDERECLRALTERDVAHTHLVPTMFVRLLRLPEAERKRFRAPALSLVLHGAAPVSVAVKRRMIEWWGPCLVEYWGGTEGGVTTLVDSAEWLAHPGTVGRPLPAFEVWAVDEEGRRLPSGGEGELFCRHATHERVFEYHGDPDKTARAHPAPHVFTLGDVGRVDAEGYVYLLDRKSAMIVSGGVNVYPAEVEQVLVEHPAVADAAVFGIPDEEWGESVKAAIELRPGHEASPALEQEILAFARERLARFKVPRSVDFERELPRHPSGKLYTRRLRDRYWQGRDGRI